jgi:hypothetical protein
VAQEFFRQQALDKLNSPDDLNELLTITSPKSWLLLGAIGLLLLSALLWGLLATIETAVPGQGVLVDSANGEMLAAVLYVSIADGKRIQPGMMAKIAPDTVRREEFGMLRATVTSVQPLPSTEAEMVAVLGSDALVQALASEGSIIEVRLALAKDNGTQSGYDWTSAEGPPVRLWGGTFSEGSIIISQQRPIDLMLIR